MININFKANYKILHFTNEIGKYMAGGIATYIDQLYKHHTEDTGFVHFYDDEILTDIRIESYPGIKDILSVSYKEIGRLKEINFQIAIVHFYGLSFIAEEEILKNKKLVYVVHSVPATEPYAIEDPFGGNYQIQKDFETLSYRADAIICVLEAEKEKLKSLYPELENKIYVIHNGMEFDSADSIKRNVKPTRRNFGFIGRLDYRKGLLECIKAFKKIDGELHIACDNQDPFYLSAILNYIEAAEMQNKIHFYGWCHGERKKAFLNSLDALIIPSLYEPFGYVVLEAINAKTPVITSRNGGISEIIGEYKYTFDPYQEGELEKAIKTFQEDTVEEIEKEMEKLYKRKELFTAQKMVEKYTDLFNSLL
ncbi:Glycosyltransferase involved in cell wall bisynthesis [Thermoanaerobacter uzonensis DSM 18761]|uniref:Glycosyltransferase involved in cell wall bisynthesis n=1 Tax=Thermoanaerobacter uzonensis DSM 18761 TaxID=1123369 RepID=A0A1M4YHX7_9THEO|nr:glycosyltransferase family 4 protein [Thermoanaerobacter uzonensis]SHF05329.1 Glycosyltransferase involved in cell wall bisynthesis [Thermoanaerobacter uzonensis DSM 18761]